jgi:hypothetical protein
MSPASILIVVVLPAPFGPSRPKTSPSAIVRVSPSTAVTSPNLRMRFLVSITSASLSRQEAINVISE